jgi:hypothetical protein
VAQQNTRVQSESAQLAKKGAVAIAKMRKSYVFLFAFLNLQPLSANVGFPSVLS